MPDSNVLEVSCMVRQAVEAGRPYLDEERCVLLVEAADRGDLLAVHNLLVEGMIELRGIGFTRKLLQEVDGGCAHAGTGFRAFH